MSNGVFENDLVSLSSTYCILTAERIFERFNIHMDHDALKAVIKNADSVYYKLLRVPFHNVINGIILQQAYDYQVYLQKIFVDYFASGNGNDNQESPGASIRESMEENRVKLIAMSESFDNTTYTHKTLIAESQARLIELTGEMQPISETLDEANRIEQAMSTFRERGDELGQILRNYRIEFKTLILDTLRLTQLLPDYRPDEIQDTINREMLYFDDQLGG